MFIAQLVSWYQARQRWQPRADVTMDDFEEFEEEAVDPTVKARFKSATSFLPSVVMDLRQEEQLAFYALYKQATAGAARSYDCPSRFDFKARTKFDAWSQLGAMPKAEAMQVYADRLEMLNIGWDPNVAGSSGGGFGMRPSKMAMPEEDSEDENGVSSTTVDREALLWFSAVKADDVDTVEQCYRNRTDLINTKDQHLDMTALMWAIDHGCENTVRFLMKNGADVNAVDPEGNTPLHFAAMSGRGNIVEWLIAAGADRYYRNVDGQTPAESCSDARICAILTRVPPQY